MIRTRRCPTSLSRAHRSRTWLPIWKASPAKSTWAGRSLAALTCINAPHLSAFYTIRIRASHDADGGDKSMTTRKLDEQEWHRYFDEGTRALLGRKATVEVVAADVGAEFVAEGLGIVGITYDQKG